MQDIQDLRRILARIDGKGYKAYKDIEGEYDFDSFILYIDHVQGDPFASPSKIRVRLPHYMASLPPVLFNTSVRRIALEDYLGRTIHQAITQQGNKKRGMGTSGLISIDVGAQEVLQRTAVAIRPHWVEARLHMGLPASGRTILGKEAELMICEDLPRIIELGMRWHNLSEEEGEEFVACLENQEFMRAQLRNLGLVAFIADGAILPRESGASDRPMSAEQAIPFQSPESLRVTLSLASPTPRFPGTTKVSGMGIPNGVTVIVGGGYHGKSTLLHALQHSVYSHIPGDGREYVVTCYDSVKIRAEDGRRVEQVNISPFISNLPYGRSTQAFSSDDASGSTSQAANIIEALEVGARVLLVDEDTSATNFMVRDARMQALVAKEFEPITPFLERVRELYDTLGVSTVLVMGGSGDYFDVADTVIMMRDFVPHDVTAEAKHIAESYPNRRRDESVNPMQTVTPRTPIAESFDPSRGKRDVKIDAKTRDIIMFGTETIELRCVKQLVDMSQTRAIGYAIYKAAEQFMDGKRTLSEVAHMIEQYFNEHGLDSLDPFHRQERHPGNFARPRAYEIIAAINRLRTASIVQQTDE